MTLSAFTNFIRMVNTQSKIAVTFYKEILLRFGIAEMRRVHMVRKHFEMPKMSEISK